VLGEIAGILGAHGISIATVIQQERSNAAVPVVIKTHEAREADVQAALRRIRRLRTVKGEPTCLRIEERLA
jgi:homoserine dehydrogenase